MSADSSYKELKAGWKNTVDVPAYTEQDVAKHNVKSDCWIIIHGKVYNVTEYLRDHPGGADVLLEVAGGDATAEYEDVGHSEDAGEIMHGYMVGVLQGYVPPSSSDTETSTPKATVVVHRADAEHAAATQAKSAWTVRTELALLAVGAAGLSYFLNSYHLLPSFASAAGPRTPHPSTGHGSFTRGFMTATAALVVAGAVGVGYLDRVLNAHQSFSAYPAHIPSSTAKPTAFKPAGVLEPGRYQKLRLRSKEELSDGIYRFVFDLPTRHAILGLPIGQHVAIRATIAGHTVVRSYTPVSSNRDLGRLELLIRVYPDGAMGNFLKGLAVGDAAEIRGPKGAMKYRRRMSRELGMVAGGTGITPLFQLIRAICEDARDDTRIALVYANRAEPDIMLRDRIDAYARAHPDKLRIHYTLDRPSPDWAGGRGHVDKELLRDKMPPPSPDNKVLLCGPPGMVNAVKGALVDLGFEKPSAVSKATDQIFCF